MQNLPPHLRKSPNSSQRPSKQQQSAKRKGHLRQLLVNKVLKSITGAASVKALQDLLETTEGKNKTKMGKQREV